MKIKLLENECIILFVKHKINMLKKIDIGLEVEKFKIL